MNCNIVIVAMMELCQPKTNRCLRLLPLLRVDHSFVCGGYPRVEEMRLAAPPRHGDPRWHHGSALVDHGALLGFLGARLGIVACWVG